MGRRAIETWLAYFTIGALAVFAPLETWVSWTVGGSTITALFSPFYLVDFIGMVLMGAGVAHSLRSRPDPAPGMLCAAYAWMGSNGWCSTFGRVQEVAEGKPLHYGEIELTVVAGLTMIALGCLALSAYLTVRAVR